MKKIDNSTKRDAIHEASLMLLMFSVFLMASLSFITENSVIFPARMGLAITLLILFSISFVVYNIIMKIKIRSENK